MESKVFTFKLKPVFHIKYLEEIKSIALTNLSKEKNYRVIIASTTSDLNV